MSHLWHAYWGTLGTFFGTFVAVLALPFAALVAWGLYQLGRIVVPRIGVAMGWAGNRLPHLALPQAGQYAGLWASFVLLEFALWFSKLLPQLFTWPGIVQIPVYAAFLWVATLVLEDELLKRFAKYMFIAAFAVVGVSHLVHRYVAPTRNTEVASDYCDTKGMIPFRVTRDPQVVNQGASCSLKVIHGTHCLKVTTASGWTPARSYCEPDEPLPNDVVYLWTNDEPFDGDIERGPKRYTRTFFPSGK